jgi:antitoxin YefM
LVVSGNCHQSETLYTGFHYRVLFYYNFSRPLGEFKTGISACLQKGSGNRYPLIITQNGRPAGVLLSADEYDNLVYRKQFIESVEQGLMAAVARESLGTDEVIARVA